MAIGRVAGPLLQSDLDRQGVDLKFTTNNQPLLYLDFANFRAAINSDASTALQTFTINGNARIGPLVINGDTITSDTNELRLGPVAGIKITGGSPNYVMTTDGTGNLSFRHINDISSTLDLTGTNVVLGDPIDLSLKELSSYRYWTGNTTVTDAVDNLNQVMLNVYQNTYVGFAEVTATPNVGNSSLSVQFNANVLGNPDTFFWDFGDGNTSTQQNPSHTYTNVAGGVYSVYFKASNSTGTLSGTGQHGDPVLAQGSYYDVTLTDYITVYTPMPIPSFTLSSTLVDSGSSVSLTNFSQYAESYTIHWGDGYTDTIVDNYSVGAPGRPPISHTYTNISGNDAQRNVTIDAYSSTAQPGGVTVTSSPNVVSVFSLHTPTVTINPSSGNNQHTASPHGLNVTFTNTTASVPLPYTAFLTHKFEYTWGDGTTTDVLAGSGQPGDRNVPVVHAFTLSDPTVQQTFIATLRLYTKHSASPFSSATQSITVFPAPTAVFTGTATVISDRTGDTAQTGYMFVDLDGVNRAEISFDDTASLNANEFTWSYGDGNSSSLLNMTGVQNHTYGSTGLFSASLLAHGPSSISLTDDTLTKVDYITIKNAPVPPAGLSTKTISIATVGSSPLYAANATNNSTEAAPAPGTSVNRITTLSPVATSQVVNTYNSYLGTLSAVVNGLQDGSVVLDGNDDTGVNGALTIDADFDAHAIDPAIYPSRFYNVFSGKVSKANASVPVGYNTYQMSHSMTGSTNILGFVKDNLVSVPTVNIAGVNATVTSLGSPVYMSGIPYFTTGGVVQLAGVLAQNWIGQTYLNTATPMTISATAASEGSGTLVSSQTKSYTNLDGSATYLSSGIPKADTGVGSAYAIGNLSVAINGSAAVCSKLAISLTNVNGTSSLSTVEKFINLYSVPLTGFNELSIPVSVNLGGSYTDNGKRIYISGAAGLTPDFNSALNYYVNLPFTGPITMTGTDEAVTRFGTLAHNVTNFALHLPPGPDLGGRAGTQYFRFAFRRSTVANFTITYTGKISGLWIAAPGTAIDIASSFNGWIDGTRVYAGAGVPGDITGLGNGSVGCAKTSGDVIPVGVSVSNKSYTMTLGSANSSDATGNQIFVSIALNAGDSITSMSIS